MSNVSACDNFFRAPVTEVRYAVRVDGQGAVEQMYSPVTELNSTSLTVCDCVANKVHRLYLLTEFDTVVQESELTMATREAWIKANPGEHPVLHLVFLAMTDFTYLLNVCNRLTWKSPGDNKDLNFFLSSNSGKNTYSELDSQQNKTEEIRRYFPVSRWVSKDLLLCTLGCRHLFHFNLFNSLRYFWWLVRVTLVIAFGFLPHNFGRLALRPSHMT